MKTDIKLESDVLKAMTWEPSLRMEKIGVMARNGVITLTGKVESFLKKTEAEETAKKARGVLAVVNDIEIELDSQTTKQDHDITIDLQKAFHANWDIPDDKITVSVSKGWITITGDLEWGYQRDATQAATRQIKGVTGLTNAITIRSVKIDKIEKLEIEKALVLCSAIDDREIHVTVTGNIVSLAGVVSTLYEKEQAGRIAQNTPGVLGVENGLVIE
ncbi:MAG TPA: BON domain-containing protein [Chryseolinea sp.]